MIYQYTLRAICYLYIILLKTASTLRKRKRQRRDKLEILITGTFYSDNWLITHLKPLAMSDKVARVRMVSIQEVPSMDKVEGIYPPESLVKLVGGVPARWLYFVWMGFKTKPDIMGGFHLLINGLLAILFAKILGIESLYICGGGPREVEGGGIETESKIFNRLSKPDEKIENYLLTAIDACDLVIVMGTGASDYFTSNNIQTRIEIVPGGFDSEKFKPATLNKEYDLILVGRLSKVKRVEIFLEAIANLHKDHIDVTAVIVGDGPDASILKERAQSLDILQSVHFAGWQSNVHEWMAKSRIFALTSESEGLSQALIQGMMSGLPAVVTDIGDLSDLVKDGVNGYLIDDLDSEKFSQAYGKLLRDYKLYETMSDRAFRDTQKYSYSRVAQQWDDILNTQQKKQLD